MNHISRLYTNIKLIHMKHMYYIHHLDKLKAIFLQANKKILFTKYFSLSYSPEFCGRIYFFNTKKIVYSVYIPYYSIIVYIHFNI